MSNPVMWHDEYRRADIIIECDVTELYPLLYPQYSRLGWLYHFTCEITWTRLLILLID